MRTKVLFMVLILTIACVASAGIGGDACSALIAHYKLNDNAAGTAVVDSAGSHNGSAQQDSEFLQVNGIRWHPFINTHGTLLDGFENVNDWIVSGTGATAANSTDIFRFGAQSIKFDATGGNTAELIKSDLTLDLSSGDGFPLWFYVSDRTKISEITLYIASEADYSKHFYTTIIPAMNGWNYIMYVKAEFTAVGGELWTNTMVKVKFRITPVAGQDATIYLDDFRFGTTGKTKVIICFDDGNGSAVSKAYPIMAGNSQAGVAFVVSSLIGTGAYMTIANLTTLKDAGWDISNHSAEHNDLTGLSQAAMEADIDDCYDWLVANGFGDTAKFFAYPYGAYNAAVIAKLKERHVTARIVGNLKTHFDILDLDDRRYMLGGYNIAHTVSTATVQTQIDRAISRGGLLTLLFHQIVDAEAGEGEYLTADFETISDYLKTKQDAGDLEVITYSDYYDELINNVPKINGSVGFNGVDDYVEITDHADFTPALSPFSVSAWIYMHDATEFIVASKGVYNTDGEWRFATETDDKLYAIAFDESVADCYIGRICSTALTSYENTWIHITLTYDGGTISDGFVLYVNGIKADDANNQNAEGSFEAVENLDHAVWVGRDADTYADGLIDNVMFFNAEFTPAEVKRIYNNGQGTEIPAEIDAAIRPRRSNTSALGTRARYEFG